MFFKYLLIVDSLHLLVSLLLFQHGLTVLRAVPLSQDASERGLVCEQLLQLADVLLDGYCVQLQKMRAEIQAAKHKDLTQEYQQRRMQIVQPLCMFVLGGGAVVGLSFSEIVISINMQKRHNNSHIQWEVVVIDEKGVFFVM